MISKKMDMMVATGYSMSIGGMMLISAGKVIGIKSPWNISMKVML